MPKLRKRKYSQDFSGNSLTDQSFATACDVNAIVRHYETTGIDPYQDRLKNQKFGVATVLSYEDAMRHKAELDSYTAENPNWQEEALQAAEAVKSADPSLPPAKLDAEASGVSDAAKLAPQATERGDD